MMALLARVETFQNTHGSALSGSLLGFQVSARWPVHLVGILAFEWSDQRLSGKREYSVLPRNTHYPEVLSP